MTHNGPVYSALKHSHERSGLSDFAGTARNGAERADGIRSYRGAQTLNETGRLRPSLGRSLPQVIAGCSAPLCLSVLFGCNPYKDDLIRSALMATAKELTVNSWHHYRSCVWTSIYEVSEHDIIRSTHRPRIGEIDSRVWDFHYYHPFDTKTPRCAVQPVTANIRSKSALRSHHHPTAHRKYSNCFPPRK
jgi:hypothetical protein